MGRIRNLLAVLLGLMVGALAAADLYVYEGPDGTRWLSDRPPAEGDYRWLTHYPARHGAAACRGAPPDGPVRYRPLIERHARRCGLSPELIEAVIAAESCFNPRAVSRAGAQGLMQLMPETARRYGVLDPMDPAANIRAGVQHLCELLDAFDGRLPEALAAYNAGDAAVRRHGGLPPYPETRRYVERVLADYRRRRGR